MTTVAGQPLDLLREQDADAWQAYAAARIRNASVTECERLFKLAMGTLEAIMDFVREARP